MYNLGNLFGKLGRHHEALEMEERALEFRKRIFPENHPAIGAEVVKLCTFEHALHASHASHALLPQVMP
jgi:hypothetical protein